MKVNLKAFEGLRTPFYYYDVDVLNQTLNAAQQAAGKYGFNLHYALKANANQRILKLIHAAGYGADCVSGNEVQRALDCGFDADHVVFAGVGKRDDEIELGLKKNIFCFNCESIEELEVIDGLAKRLGVIANIALRLNPNLDANTHHYITTGLEENKFGINLWQLNDTIQKLKSLSNLKFQGLHFHIGSQITDLQVFKSLCVKVNEVSKWFRDQHLPVAHLNVGGGLGVNYHQPDDVIEFESYFELFNRFLEREPQQQIHFEPGRALVAHCGSLITRVLFVKHGINTHFVIADAGMTELIRPALYQSYHTIQNVSKASQTLTSKYDVVGPICESSDCFGKAVSLPETQRGDLMAIRTTGAYGESMASQYNLRDIAPSIFSDQL